MIGCTFLFDRSGDQRLNVGDVRAQGDQGDDDGMSELEVIVREYVWGELVDGELDMKLGLICLLEMEGRKIRKREPGRKEKGRSTSK